MKKTELEARVKQLEETLESVNKSMYENGLHLNEQPFIPEYLGFTHTPVKDANDIIRANIYTKHGYNISKYIDTDKQEWIVMRPDGERTEVKLDTMYNAFIILNALGCPLPMNMYIKDGKL